MSRLLTTLVMFTALGFVVSTSYAQKLAPEELSNSSYALDANGTLYDWGFNGWGQLGNGNTTDQYTPVVVSFPGGVTITAIAAGANHALGIGSDGNLYTWGLNGYGQLGDGTTTQRKMPVATSLTCKAIAAGQSHSLAIGTDGKLYTWGCNQRGQLGDGTTNDSHTPVMRTSATWTAIAAGQNHSSGIDNNGNLYTWGDNTYGQLGNGTYAYSYTPIGVTNPTGVTSWTAIATGGNCYNLAIGNDGKIYAWGWNSYGQLGDNSKTNRNTPVAVVGLPGGVTWTAIAAGTAASFALGSDGNIYAWGSNSHGELGNNTKSFCDSTPVVVTMPTGVTSWKAIAAGNSHSLAIGNDGYLYAWGSNYYGGLGNGAGGVSAPDDSIPVRVLGVGGIGDLALPVEVTGFCAVSKASCAVLTWKTQSEVDMAGFNIYRQDPGSSSFNLIASYKTDDNLKSLGTSTSDRTYTFIDRKVQARNTYTYKLQSVSTNSMTKDYDPISVRVGVPESYGLSQNYPNPFNPATTISYQLAADSHVTLRVYDVLGREVATLVDEMKSAGEYTVKFDGSKFASGVYFYRFNAAGVSQVKGMLLSK